MKTLIGDFHIHTLLSPCAEIEMTPHHIVMQAAEYGVQLLAVTDHNASANAVAAVQAGERYGVKVFPGMEVECREEAHIVALFDNLKQLRRWQKIVDFSMRGLKNIPERFGAQFVVDDDDNFVAEEERMLLGPLQLSAQEVVRKVNEIGGLCLAAHIDRPAYSLLMQLGFIPPDMGLFGVEISRNSLAELTQLKLKRLASDLPYVTNSDAHRMLEFLEGPKNRITIEEATVAELKLALAGKAGRSCLPGYFISDLKY